MGKCPACASASALLSVGSALFLAVSARFPFPGFPRDSIFAAIKNEEMKNVKVLIITAVMMCAMPAVLAQQVLNLEKCHELALASNSHLKIAQERVKETEALKGAVFDLPFFTTVESQCPAKHGQMPCVRIRFSPSFRRFSPVFGRFGPFPISRFPKGFYFRGHKK